jgi:hypothetical protein
LIIIRRLMARAYNPALAVEQSCRDIAVARRCLGVFPLF